MATQLNRTNYSVLPWYTALKYQNDLTQFRLGYGAYGEDVWPLVSELYKLPPFQIIRPTDEGKGEMILTLKLHRVDSALEWNILTELTTAGMAIETFADYDIIRYPGLTGMEDITLEPGVYYCSMTWGAGEDAQVRYSEKFEMLSVIEDYKFVKLNFWHHDPFDIPIGHISYSDPFYNFIYCKASVVNKPKPRRDDQIEENDGYDFPIYQISQVTFGFTGFIPEYMMMFLRLVEHHDYKTIEFDGITYNPVKFQIDMDEPIKEGHAWQIRCEFEINSVVQTTGRILPENAGFEYVQTEYDDAEYQ